MDDSERSKSDIDSLYSGPEGDIEEEKPSNIGKKETSTVWKLKVVVFLVVIGAAVGTALAVLFYTRGSEESQFEEQFNEYADKVLDSIGGSFATNIGALDALATDSLAHARGSGQTWPLVNIPFFGARAAKIISISDIFFVSLCPVVKNGVNRLEWENFTATYGRAWVDEYMELQKTDKNYYGPIIEEWEDYNVIHGDFGDSKYSKQSFLVKTLGPH
jgi:hypothetical protein